MTPDEIQALTAAPVILVLIYLIVRMQAEKERLITGIIELEREHAKALLEIIDRYGYPPPPPQKGPN